MNPWTLAEIRQAARFFLADGQQELAEEHFVKIGPIPRYCIEYAGSERDLDQYDTSCQSAALCVTTQSLKALLSVRGNIDLDKESHKLFLVRRDEINILERAHLEPISTYVEMLLVKAIDSQEMVDRFNLYNAFASVEQTRQAAGVMFESLGHTRFVEGITLHLINPVTSGPARTLYHWNFQDEDSSAPDSMDVDTTPITFLRGRVETFEGWPRTIEPNCLYIPRQNNLVAVDSFFLLNGTHLFFFQFTMSPSHDIKDSFIKKLQKLPNLPSKENWFIVYVTPPGCRVNVQASLAMQAFLGPAQKRMAHLQIEQPPEGFFQRIWRQIRLGFPLFG